MRGTNRRRKGLGKASRMTGATWDHDHILHIGGETEIPPDPAAEPTVWRKRIEPWLSAVFQAEHISLLLGNGFTTGIANQAGGITLAMDKAEFGCDKEDKLK